LLSRVLKFGGSALAGAGQIETATRHVAATREAGAAPIVVVSAVAGVTNRLLSAARRVHPDPPGDELDRLLSTGELQAAALLAIALRGRGLRARSFSGAEAGIVTDESYGRARIEEIRPGPLTASIAAGEIPVVTGFQGVTRDGSTTTLGRGSSDVTALALAVGLGSDRAVFYRDVDGVHSADPNLLAVSYRFDQLDYAAMTDLAEAGVPIVHAQAIEIARAHEIPIELRGFAPGSGRTVISAEPLLLNMPVWSISLSPPLSMLTLDGLPLVPGFLARLLAMVERSDLSIEAQLTPGSMARTGNDRVCLDLLLPDNEGPRLRDQMNDYLREEQSLQTSLERRRRRVTLVGRGVGSRRVSKAVESVGQRLGPPMATFWGANHRAFVVPEREGQSWLASLHQELITP
jgi:aspartate kinase